MMVPGILAAVSCAPGVTADAFDAAKRGTVERDVVYAAPGGVPVAMDLHYPGSRGPWPCVVAIHGGGWSEGDKAGFDFGLAKRGYLVASVNYRLHPAFRFPAMIEDVKSAIRFLRARAAACNLDPARIALLGHSAGGHLAALAGLAGPEAGWDVGDNLDVASTVAAVIVIAGPTDLRRDFPQPWADELRRSVFGPEQWEAASPVTWARADAPPFLVIHGDADTVVPVEQARLLVDALARAGARATLVVARRTGHGFEPVGAVAWPPAPLLMARALRFLRRALK